MESKGFAIAGVSRLVRVIGSREGSFVRALSQSASSAPIICVVDNKRHTRIFLRDEIEGLGFMTQECADTDELASMLRKAPDVVVSRIAEDPNETIEILNLLHANRFRGDILLVGSEETATATVENCGRRLKLAMLAPLETPYRAVDLHDRLFKFLPPPQSRSWSVNIAESLQHERFELWYQGKIDARRLEVRGAEASIVWRHPAERAVSHVQVLGKEDHPHLEQLSEFVLTSAVQDCASFFGEGGYPGFAVNLPVLRIPDQRLVDQISALVAGHPAMPTLLLQIRAAEFAANRSRIAGLLRTIRRSNVGISIDDFEEDILARGVFEDIPILEIKVDHTVLPDHPNDRRRYARCNKILDLARRYGLRAVVKGVDAPYAFSLARDVGFDQVQGPLFGGPATRDKFARTMLPRQSRLSRQASRH